MTIIETGDTVRFRSGLVDWDVLEVRYIGSTPFALVLKSGLTGRERIAWPRQVRLYRKAVGVDMAA